MVFVVGYEDIGVRTVVDSMSIEAMVGKVVVGKFVGMLFGTVVNKVVVK